MGGSAMETNKSQIISGSQASFDTEQGPAFSSQAAGKVDSLQHPSKAKASSAVQVSPYEKMQKSIHSWGIWLVLWTVYSAVTSNVEWAIVLAAAAVMSFYFSEVAGMFIVYGGLMAWAAIWNILFSGDARWMVTGAIQVVFSIVAFVNYAKYRNAKASQPVETSLFNPSTTIARDRKTHLAWLSLVFGLIGLAGLGALITVSIVFYEQEINPWIDTVIGTFFEVGFLGLPVGIAALFTNRRHWGAAVMGIILGCLAAFVLIISILMFSA